MKSVNSTMDTDNVDTIISSDNTNSISDNSISDNISSDNVISQADTLKFFCNNKNFKYKRSPSKSTSKLEEDDLVTCGTYLKKKRINRKWSVTETNKFYRALDICGCDFGMIEKIFKNRSRKNIKDKFITENRKQMHKIEEVLKKRNGFNKEAYESLTKEE